MEITNTVRQRVWRCQPKGFLREALIDTDGTMAPTFGECKGGMALSYKGIWGYAPLVVSLANTNEVLYLVNRPGNVVSHEGCVPWIDRAIKLVAPHAGQITLRGDTDFTLTGELDRWDEQGIKFIFGMDAHPKVVNLAEALPEEAWKPLKRLPRYEIVSRPRRKPERVKESIVCFKGYENKVLVGEDIAEIEYRPRKCSRPIGSSSCARTSVCKRAREPSSMRCVTFSTLPTAPTMPGANRQSGQRALQSGERHRAAQKWGRRHAHAGGRFAEQLGLYGDDLLAWNLKAWFGLLLPDGRRGAELIKMEFRRFLHAIVLLPAQIVRTGKRVIYRLMSYNRWLKDLFAGWEHLRRLDAT